MQVAQLHGFRSRQFVSVGKHAHRGQAALLDDMDPGVSDRLVRSALDARYFVETRVTDGSVGPRQVARLLEKAFEQHAADIRWLAETNAGLRNSREALDRTVHQLIGLPAPC